MIAIPIVITLIAFAVAFYNMPKMEDTHNSALAGIAIMVEGFVGLFFLALAAIVSLISWLIYVGAT